MKMMKTHHEHTLCLRITIIIFVRVYNIINSKAKFTDIYNSVGILYFIYLHTLPTTYTAW